MAEDVNYRYQIFCQENQFDSSVFYRISPHEKPQFDLKTVMLMATKLELTYILTFRSHESTVTVKFDRDFLVNFVEKCLM